MRITGNRLMDVSSAASVRTQSTVAEVAEQVTSGLRVGKPSDDPSAWLAAQRTKLRQAMSQGTGAAVDASRERLSVTDNALASIGDAVSQIRQLAIQGSSGTYNPDDRAGLGAQIRGLFDAAVASANVRGIDGEYLLAGDASLTAPFDAAGVYHGDAATRSVPTGDAITDGTSIAGASLTAAHGTDVLPLMDRIATAMANNDMPTLLAALPDLETAVKQISFARSQTGGAINVLDQTTSARTALEQDMSRAISRYVEVDTVTAASDLAKATQSLEVSRAVSSHIIAMLAAQTST
jgi:flagellar hook-associated protein 3 FlgL